MHMRFLQVVLAAAALGAPAALAQEIPAQTDQALWCGLAFGYVANEAEKAGSQAAADDMRRWGEGLLGQARTELGEADFPAERIAELEAEYSALAQEQVNAGAVGAKYSYEDCVTRVGPAAAEARGAPAVPPTPPAPVAPAQ